MNCINRVVTVIAPARLHMGFLDLSGAMGREFGSIGLSVDGIQTRVTLQHAERTSISGSEANRAEKYLDLFCRELGVPKQLALNVEQTIPSHVGLGSGTQMALAVGAAINAYYNLGCDIRRIAQLSGRGARSGIGIGVFEQGGLIVDGGRGVNTQTPPVLVRMPIPPNWRLLLIFDRRGQGLHGEFEIEAFKRLPTFPRAQAAELCYRLIMQALPALAEQNLSGFGQVISDLQQAVGQHFAPAQGGIFTSPEVAKILDWLTAQGLTGIGQTSWGPTGFCLVQDEQQAQSWREQILQRFNSPHIAVEICRARNQAAEIIVSEH